MKRALIASAVLYASAPLGVHFKARAAPKDMVAVGNVPPPVEIGSAGIAC